MSVVSGKSVFDVISAMPGGKAEKVLRAIAHPRLVQVPENVEPSQPFLRNRRQFADWVNNRCHGCVIREDGTKINLTLKLGVKEGLFLEDDRYVSYWSPKPEGVILIGSCSQYCHVTPEVLEKRIEMIAHQIVGTYIGHGVEWVNTNGERIVLPFGRASSAKQRKPRSRAFSKRMRTF